MAIIIFKHCPSILLEKSLILIYLVNCGYKNYTNSFIRLNIFPKLNFLNVSFESFTDFFI